MDTGDATSLDNFEPIPFGLLIYASHTGKIPRGDIVDLLDISMLNNCFRRGRKKINKNVRDMMNQVLFF